MEGLLHYINPAHAISLLSALNEERLKGQLCDVLLIVGDKKFRAHKNVLAASSEYFQTLFTSKENETQSVFQLDFCEPDAFDNVLNYIYSSSLFVEKSSLAAVQELGYSLGISFLTNILSKTPHAPYAPSSNKKISYSEDDEGSSQQRSVIVRQRQNEMQAKNTKELRNDLSHASKSLSLKVNPRSFGTKLIGDHPQSQSSGGSNWQKGSDTPSGYTKLLSISKLHDDHRKIEWSKGNAGSTQPSFGLGENEDHNHGRNTSLPMRKPVEISPKRPSLCSALSVQTSLESSYLQQEAGKSNTSIQGEDRKLLYYSKLGYVVPSSGSGPETQTVDRSGPLVKSLLRRSLSMDSQVPLHSSSFDFKTLHKPSTFTSDAPETTFSASSEKAYCSEDPAEHTLKKDKAEEVPSHRLRSFSASQSAEVEDASPIMAEVQIKTEPSSPLSDPSEIIKVTVGDSSPSTSRDFPLKPERGQGNFTKFAAKRRFKTDGRRLLYKKSKPAEEDSQDSEENFDESSSPTNMDADHPDSDHSKDDYNELEDLRPNKKFKCKNCPKIFRSTAGLYRHVNMYHNPEKPYSCDICHKRFHTNFKVWTHCQTQHGIVRNPSPASSSHAVLDEKFQRKLIDIVREREIKKALIVKLRRNKQGYQGQSTSQAQQVFKKNLRSRNKGAYICGYCGKVYRFLSQFKQHIKMHPGEKPLMANRAIKPKEPQPPENTVKNKEILECRLCSAKLTSLIELGNHERLCRNATVCPYCSLRFATPELKHEHEGQCEYKKLTCLECMRTFKSSFSIWRHQVEVHNQNTMAPTENFSLPLGDHNGEIALGSPRIQPAVEANKLNSLATSKDDGVFSDSSEQMNFESEDSSCLPEDLSISKQLKIQVKEEPLDDVGEEDFSESGSLEPKERPARKEGGLWSCEKCGKIFTVHKQLERHQELLCSVKPFICQVCNKAFRTNFRLWSHFQSHMAQPADESTYKEPEARPSSSSPSPPPPLPPQLPKIELSALDKPETEAPEKSDASEKEFSPQESDTLFYHAPPLSAITFKRQYMCKLCHRTFRTAFSLWSHEQAHN
ncbi:zinc finger and BTB domain-containing protein 21 [Latimeria chalumnae]|uniref:Zinc finger and BTB domain containing 21 n=1 Tax=Latimeria chalumnae TaxID=7897 RepID=H3AXR9_LATCH|nr:PREDICTED: zinc finger and BTB domain-containing protein 21 [Latimeria chalumnae]XP_006001527.1 PREDICTED: zinc finger and BTB domain-containing protein 21 [Latimeria chalumnae]|eukprot:XP_006001526.1 PREDICTED: zinc finger and BTB domain-containing protein 21 [Latimeria chalumnae]